MAFRTVTKICKHQEALLRLLWSEANPASISASSRREYTSNGSQLRLEGVQGPLHDSLMSVKQGRQLLDRAASQASYGASTQGVQGRAVHTGEGRERAAGQSAVQEMQWELEDAACPQGVQGQVEQGLGCPHFAAWLDSCRRYGLANCDQQLQGIQTGRLTLAQVLADQEARIAEIAESYKKRSEELPNVEDESFQGAQEDLRLPDVGAPCPQGVQGDDCVRFKMWLENCHRFGMHECLQQLQGFQDGRLTLAQIFSQQETAIREVVQEYQNRHSSKV